jgi:hypothetical protein
MANEAQACSALKKGYEDEWILAEAAQKGQNGI